MNILFALLFASQIQTAPLGDLGINSPVVTNVIVNTDRLTYSFGDKSGVIQTTVDESNAEIYGLLQPGIKYNDMNGNECKVYLPMVEEWASFVDSPLVTRAILWHDMNEFFAAPGFQRTMRTNQYIRADIKAAAIAGTNYTDSAVGSLGDELRSEMAAIDVSAQIAPLDARLTTAEETLDITRKNVNNWTTYLNDQSVHMVVRNYPTTEGATRSPSGKMPILELSYETTNEDDEPYTQVVWNQTWAEDELKENYLPSNYVSKTEFVDVITNEELYAWSKYDSATGKEALPNTTQISTESIFIANGLSYQKTITNGGDVWVLTGNGTIAEFGANTNGFFKISDIEGNSYFEIVKGDSYVVGAKPESIRAENVGDRRTRVIIPYNVIAETHPTLHMATAINSKLHPNAANWKAETDEGAYCDVVWSGTSGNYTATATTKSAEPQMFFYADYAVQGKTYIKNSAPVQMSQLMLNGKTYNLGTATIDGKTVLTLTETH